MITLDLITWMVIIVSILVFGLMAWLTVQIYISDQPKQRASVEADPETDAKNPELT